MIGDKYSGPYSMSMSSTATYTPITSSYADTSPSVESSTETQALSERDLARKKGIHLKTQLIRVTTPRRTIEASCGEFGVGRYSASASIPGVSTNV